MEAGLKPQKAIPNEPLDKAVPVRSRGFGLDPKARPTYGSLYGRYLLEILEGKSILHGELMWIIYRGSPTLGPTLGLNPECVEEASCST